MAFHTIAEHQLLTPQDTPFLNGTDADTPSSYVNHSTTWTPIDSMTPISTNPSRKRSRDETAFDTAGVDGSYFPSLADKVNTPAAIPEEPIYGEGMVLLNPQSGHYISPESQSGTWLEEKVAEQASEPKPSEQMPDFRPQLPSSRKSIRLSQSAVPSMLNTNSPSTAMTAGFAPASPPKSSSTHPEVDETTLALGIGWTKIASEDVDIQAAARGWARYLENHYARFIHGAEILLKSSGLNAYLVGCQEGYYLFSEDLLEGKLVARTWEQTLANLRAGPAVFEGVDILRAERTPGPETRKEEVLNGWVSAVGNDDEGRVQIQSWADYDRLNGDAPAMLGSGMEID